MRGGFFVINNERSCLQPIQKLSQNIKYNQWCQLAQLPALKNKQANCVTVSNEDSFEGLIMEIGETYDIVFSTGKYEIEYENSVECIKITPKNYRIKRLDGSTRLVGHDSIMNIKKCHPILKQPTPHRL